MKKIRVEVWSDIACPWCYVGKRRFESALATFAHKDEVELVWRAFELDPSAPKVTPADQGSHAERLARKYGMTVSEAEGRIRSLVETAAKDGLEMRFDRVKSGNTFDAHRLIHLADTHGKQGAMKERLLRAYFTEGEAVSDPETLVRLATEVGIDADEARATLASDRFAADVRSEESDANRLGIRGVPFFVIGRYGVSGAQPADALVKVLDKAWEEAPAVVESVAAEGATCGVDGCA